MNHRKTPRNHNTDYSVSPGYQNVSRTADTGHAASDIHAASSLVFAGEHRRHIGQSAAYREDVASHSATMPPSEMHYRQFPPTAHDRMGSSKRHGSYRSGGFRDTNKNSTTANITAASSHGSVDSDKGLGFHNGSMAYSHAASGASQMFPPPEANPIVQTNNRLTEDYSRRIHCYISSDQDDSSLQSDHMPPPVLPPLQELRSGQDMPFWRPPRVLQQEPHYNRAYSSAPTQQSPAVSRTDSVDYLRSSGHSASSSLSYSMAPDGTSSLLSPALLAISNSHYEQHRRQQNYERQQPECTAQVGECHTETVAARQNTSVQAAKHVLGPNGKTDTGTTLPPIHALTDDISAGDSTAYQCTGGAFRDRFDTSEGGEKDATVARPDGFGAHLPPIYSKRRRSKDGQGLSGPSPAPGIGTRKFISIPRLVDNQRPASSRKGSTDTQQYQNTHTSTSTASALSLSDYSSGSGSSVLNSSHMGSRKRSYGAADAALSLHKLARTEPELSLGRTREPPLTPVSAAAAATTTGPLNSRLMATSNDNLVVITCYHASVAQKSYGGEKRFLCPPPAVLLCGDGYSAEIAHHSPMLLSVTADTDAHSRIYPSQLAPRESTDGLGQQNSDSSNSGSGNSVRPSSSSHAPLECQTSFNERNVALFKSLHVTGMQKAKSFRLQLDLLIPTSIGIQLHNPHDSNRWRTPDVYASLESDPVAIISKPSKKTAKARNQSTCIRAGSLISLFNRINSQTFRTKYLNVDHNTNRWVAQSHNWSPLEVVVLSDNGSDMTGAPRGSDQAQQPDRRPLFYGSKIVLVESRRNFRSPPMIIHKVERGRLVEDARSPVSQMQKIALQLKPSVAGGPTQFLKADVGHYSPVVAEGGSNMHFDDSDGSPELAFEALENARISRTRARDTRGDGGIEIDDAFCWTIVGISGFTYSYSLPSECPDPVRYIGPIPRAADIFVAKGGGRLEMCALNFDPTQMQLVLNKTALCLCTPHENGMSVRDTHSIQQKNQTLASAAAISRVGGGASAKRSEADPANKPDDGTIHTFQLPPNTQPGILFIRRTDGVLYHTKWELKQNPASCILEAVACMLDI